MLPLLRVLKGGGKFHKDGTSGEGSGGARIGAGRKKKDPLAITTLEPQALDEHPQIPAPHSVIKNWEKDFPTEEYTVNEVNQALQRLTADATVSVRRSLKSFTNVAKAGRLGTQFEIPAGTSNAQNLVGGSYDPELRAEMEYSILGILKDSPAKDRPIYGYIRAPDEDNDAVSHYGYVEYRLKPEVRNRTYITTNDSLSYYGTDDSTYNDNGELDNLNRPYMLPTKLTNPDYHSVKVYDREDIVHSDSASKLYRNRISYIEAQIVGGVKLDDVDRIVIHGGYGLKDVDKEALDIYASHRIPIEQSEFI